MGQRPVRHRVRADFARLAVDECGRALLECPIRLVPAGECRHGAAENRRADRPAFYFIPLEELW
jgi:hypothetical protein